MTTRQTKILDILRKASHTTESIADKLSTDTYEVPAASVRRDIQTLQSLGHNIQYRNGFRVLVLPTQAPAPVQAEQATA